LLTHSDVTDKAGLISRLQELREDPALTTRGCILASRLLNTLRTGNSVGGDEYTWAKGHVDAEPDYMALLGVYRDEMIAAQPATGVVGRDLLRWVRDARLSPKKRSMLARGLADPRVFRGGPLDALSREIFDAHLALLRDPAALLRHCAVTNLSTLLERLTESGTKAKLTAEARTAVGRAAALETDTTTRSEMQAALTRWDDHEGKE
jgi:hypothetical protein